MDFFEFQSLRPRGHFIRHRNSLGELTRKEGSAEDFLFALVPRGQDRVALRSKNFPRLFLRHRDFRVRLEGPSGLGDQFFANQATFVLLPGLADPNGVSFESLDPPGHFLRHRDFHLFVEPEDDPSLASDATFFQELAPVLIDTGTDLESADN